MMGIQFAIGILCLTQCGIKVMCQSAHLNIAKSFKAENMSRNADIFEPIRQLMKPTDAEFMPYGQRRGSSNQHHYNEDKNQENFDRIHNPSGRSDYRSENSDNDEDMIVNDNFVNIDDADDYGDYDGKDKDNNNFQQEQFVKKLRTAIRDHAQEYPDYEYDVEYEEDDEEDNDGRTILEDDGIVRIKQFRQNDDDDEHDDDQSAGEDGGGDVHIHLKTLLDRKALRFLWDEVPWDEIIAANRLSRVVEERFITEHVLQKGAEDGAYDHKGHEQRQNIGAGWDNESRVRKIKKERARRIITNDIVDRIKGNHGHSKPVEQYWREPQGHGYYFNNHTLQPEALHNNQYPNNQAIDYHSNQHSHANDQRTVSHGHQYPGHLGHNNLHAYHRDTTFNNNVPNYHHNAHYGRDQHFPSHNYNHKKPKLFTWDQERRRKRFLRACKRMHGSNKCMDFWWRNDNNPYYESNFPRLRRRTQKILTPSVRRRRIDQAAMTRRPFGFNNAGLKRQTWVTKIKTKTTFK